MSNAVDPAELHVCITGTRKIRDGVAVICKNDDEMKLLKGALSTQLGGQYLVSEAKKRKPRMLTKNVTITKQISTDELIINNIISHNDNLNCSAADLRIVTKLEIGSNYDIVLEVSASVRNTLASQGVIYLGWRRCIITDHIHIVQCFKCSKFGHVEKQCKMGDRFCSECSESHNFKACSSINKVCINCMNYNKYNKTAISVSHSARDKCCTDVRNLKVKDPDNVSYVTQTTLSIDDTREIIVALKVRFPSIRGPDLKDICYAMQNRQNAVKKLAEIVDMVLVVGSKNSSNLNRLLDLCTARGIRAYLIDNLQLCE
nr:unnamed protein product [Callosobruchus chinensis]